MKNYCCCCKFPRMRRNTIVNSKKVTLLILGLDNAGKTTIVRRLGNEPNDSAVMPTVGFTVSDIQDKGCNISIYDVGGGPKIRNIWKQYYADVHGIIFVVDASDAHRIEECRKILNFVLKDPKISGKPVLLLANKQDIDGAYDEIDIVEKLGLESLVNQQKCPTLVELCAAANIQGKNDTGIENGIKWLIRCITKDYPSLNNRVLVDMASQEEIERLAMEYRKKRLQEIREQRGNDADLNEQDMEDDPFKPISQLVIKPQANGLAHPPMTPVDVSNPVVPAVTDAEDVVVPDTRLAQSQLFFATQDWSSTTELLDGLSLSRSRIDLFERPKSSGALEFKVRKRKKKRRLRFKKNKTSPIPFAEPSAQPSRPLPSIFDPAYHTQVIPISSIPLKQISADGISKQSEEVLLNVNDLSRKV